MAENARALGLRVPDTILSPDILQDIQRDLEAIETSLADACAEPGLRTGKAARRIVMSGGKRARPLLTCAVSRALGKDPTPHIDVIAAVELAHNGSLLHDDIIDGAKIRRGHRAAHLVFDVTTAILAGDILLVTGIDSISRASSPRLRVSFSEALKATCTGEALEHERLFDVTVDVGHARLVNRLKTASLFSYAAEAGAILGEAESNVRLAARTYGMAVGEAFQLADDLLDLEGDPTALGKQTGTDLAAGCVTIPVAMALERDPALRDVVLELWQSPNGSSPAVLRLRQGMDRVGALAAARQLAEAGAKRACDAIERLPAGPWRRQLAAFARAAASREG
jgi:octaprenyl-diphosphate synthase